MKLTKSTANFEYIKLPSHYEQEKMRDELAEKLEAAGEKNARREANRIIRAQYRELLDNIAKFVIDRRSSQEITITVYHGDECEGIGSGRVTADRLVCVNADDQYAEKLYRREGIFSVYAGCVLLCFGGAYFTAMSRGAFEEYIAQEQG